MLREGDERAFRTLKLLISSGAPLRTEVRQSFFARFGVPVRDQYGSTETMNVAIDLADPPEEGRMGPPLPGIEVAIFDEHDRPLPTGIVGLIGIRSPAASASYIDNPEATARVFRNGWVFPGDRGYLDKNGCLYVVGRDDVINVGGNKVDPLEVERVIREALPVREVVVIPGSRGGLPAVKVVIEADPARVTPAMVVEACRARLSAHKVPAEVDVRASIERTASGKIVRSSLGPS
jgi:long-chain acyl-CoA synthetase